MLLHADFARGTGAFSEKGNANRASTWARKRREREEREKEVKEAKRKREEAEGASTEEAKRFREAVYAATADVQEGHKQWKQQQQQWKQQEEEKRKRDNPGCRNRREETRSLLIASDQ